MPNIQPFAAYRYNPAKVGFLENVIAPPYDVIDPELQDELYDKHWNNVVRLILNKIEEYDTAEDNRYIRSAKLLKEWKANGVLVQDPQPAIYVYHQTYEVDGTMYTRKGFMCRCEAVPFGQGSIFPHEITQPGAKQDRLMLTTTCKMNFSQIFGLYPDKDNSVQNILEEATLNLPSIDAVDHLGVLNRMWIVTDPSVINAVVSAMGPKPIFIADGHHRYETACNYKEQIRQEGALTPGHPANYVLMVCIAMDDPGLIVRPTHRLFRNVPAMTQAELISKVGDNFKATTVGSDPKDAYKIWEMLSLENRQDSLAMYTRQDSKWTLLQLTETGRANMAKASTDHHPEWQQLGVAILHRFIIETLLDLHLDLLGQDKPKYVHDVREVVESLRSKKEKYELTALVMPATVELIQELSMLRERMPAKSTYFYPKLITGFVFNPLE